MSFYLKLLFVAGAIFICLFTTGCSYVSGSGRELVPVSGMVFCSDSPLNSGTVRFVLVGSDESQDAPSGEINENGSFNIKTRDETGVYPGRYRVFVTDSEGESDSTSKSEIKGNCLFGDTGQVVHVSESFSKELKILLAGPEGPRDTDEGE